MTKTFIFGEMNDGFKIKWALLRDLTGCCDEVEIWPWADLSLALFTGDDTALVEGVRTYILENI